MGTEREREGERDGVAVTGDGSCRVSNDPDHHRPHLKKTLSVPSYNYIHTTRRAFNKDVQIPAGTGKELPRPQVRLQKQ
jgi:hypothetical protein